MNENYKFNKLKILKYNYVVNVKSIHFDTLIVHKYININYLTYN